MYLSTEPSDVLGIEERRVEWKCAPICASVFTWKVSRRTDRSAFLIDVFCFRRTKPHCVPNFSFICFDLCEISKIRTFRKLYTFFNILITAVAETGRKRLLYFRYAHGGQFTDPCSGKCGWTWRTKIFFIMRFMRFMRFPISVFVIFCRLSAETGLKRWGETHWYLTWKNIFVFQTQPRLPEYGFVNWPPCA